MSNVKCIVPVTVRKRIRIIGSFNLKEAAHCFLFLLDFLVKNYKDL